MAFFKLANTILKTLVIALGAGLGVWSGVNPDEENDLMSVAPPTELIFELSNKEYKSHLEKPSGGQAIS